MRRRLDLREVQAGEEHFVVDLFGARELARLSPLELAVFRGLAAGQTIDLIRRDVQRAFEVSLSRSDVREFQRELAASALLEGGRARRDRRRAWERALVGDTLIVPTRRTASDLRLLCGMLLAEVGGDPQPRGRLEGVLSPHGDPEVTGQCSARAYASLDRESWPDVFVVLGTSHYARAPTLLTKHVQTPLGQVTCDRDVAHALLERCRPRLEPDAPEFVIEHSWVQDVPLLQEIAARIDRPLRIVAMLAGNMDHEAARRLGRLLRDVLFRQFKRACFVASGDLTHYGQGYRYSPPWAATATTIAQVDDQVRLQEEPILEAIERRDHRTFVDLVGRTSFCARAQVSALMSFVGDDGRRLAHRRVLNGAPIVPATRRGRWRPTDQLFSAAAIAFTWGGAGERRLCGSCVYRVVGGAIEIAHRCDATLFILPRRFFPILVELVAGHTSIAELKARVERRSSVRIAASELSEFVQQVEAKRLLHPYEPPSARPSRALVARAEAVIAHARAEVPFHARLSSKRLVDASVLLKNEIASNWHALFSRDAGAMAKDQLHERVSSASTSGESLRTVVEAEVAASRRFGEAMIRVDRGLGRTVRLNRGANLSIPPAPADQLLSRQEGDALLVTPGDNPTEVTPEQWQRVLAALRAFEPRTVEGDPAYLAGLARACLSVGGQLESVRRVATGHGYAWRVYLDAIERAFPEAELVQRYHSTELGEMALTCEHGAFHLNETRMCFEVLDRGLSVGQGGWGALVATTLDSRIRPLVRYAIGDVVQLLAASCRCGAPFRTVQYLGRIRHLFDDTHRRPVTYANLDALIGAPAGLRFFRLTVDEGTSRLDVCAEPAVFDDDAVKRRLEARLGRTCRVVLRKRLEIPSRGKLGSVETADHPDRWTRRFFHRGRAGSSCR